MDSHPVVAILAAARAAGIALRLVDGQVAVEAGTPPDAALLDAMKTNRADIAVISRAATELRASLIWCARQLGPDDDPAVLGYACMHHFLTLCLERSRDQQRYGCLPGESRIKHWSQS